MGHGAAPRFLDPVGDPTIFEHGKTFQTERRTSTIAKQELASKTIMGVNRNPGVQLETHGLAYKSTARGLRWGWNFGSFAGFAGVAGATVVAVFEAAKLANAE